MLRKLVIAIGAVTLIGAVHAQAKPTQNNKPKGNNYSNNQNDNNRNDNNKGKQDNKGGPNFGNNDKGIGQFFSDDKGGKGKGDSNLWKNCYTSKDNHDGAPSFDGKDYGRDCKDLVTLDHCCDQPKDGFICGHTKGCETHDSCDSHGCDDHKPCNDNCDHPCAVPLPAAASQGLVGLGFLSLLGLGATVRRRMFARA